LKSSLLIVVLGALAFAASASAQKIYGPSMRFSLSPHGQTVTMKVTVTAAYDKTGPAGSVTFSDCKLGQQTPLSLIGSKLPRDAAGGLVWRFASVPPKNSGKLTRSFRLALPQGKGGPSFCVHFQAQAKGFGKYPAKEVRISLR
jgi:hypothetical protein